MKRILFLSASTGGGHNSIGMALKRALGRYKDIRFVIMDFFEEGNPKLNKLVTGFYSVSTKRFPWLYGFLYYITNKKMVWKGISSLKYPKLKENISHYIGQMKPDMIISAHPLVNKITADIIEQMCLKIPFVIVVGDPVTYHASWIEPRADLVIVGSETAKKRFASHGVEENKIKVVGVPIDPRFYEKPTPKTIAREMYGIDQNKFTILLLGGGEGAGKISSIAKKLVRENLPINIVVVSGKNKKMMHQLSKYPIRVFGYTQEMHHIMDAVDLVVTKAGPSTIEECTAKNLPMIITSYLPGQEKGNIAYAKSKTKAHYVTKEKKVIQIIKKYIVTEKKRKQLRIVNPPVLQIASMIRSYLK